MSLRQGEQTVLDQSLKRLATSLKEDTGLQTVKKIISWIHENLKFRNVECESRELFEKHFRKRTVKQIIKSEYASGCSDFVLIFIAFCRGCGIPAKFIDGKRIGKSGGHVWAEVLIGSDWLYVDPTAKKINFDPSKAKNGPYKLIEKGLDSWDIGIRSWQDWKRKTAQL